MNANSRDPIGSKAIAAAMAKAAHMAVHGTREERSGIFNPTPLGCDPAPKPAAPRPEREAATVD